ncbi:MAG TPA: branched-chain amino acid ABC transporter permease [Symbiobacteriaceae bacterium]|nr:branched-chain amino acid ABC transporter permease [Symbiobacteriaceae bacterium]
MSFLTSLLVFMGITAIAVLSVYVLTGMAGLFSFGQAAFLAIGAYVTGIAMARYGWSFWPAVALAVLLAMAVSLLIGIPTLKLRRDYFALATFGFGEAVRSLLNTWVSFTGGAMGYAGIPTSTTPAVVAVSVIVALVLVRNFKASRFGRVCLAIKSDELTAEALGARAVRYKLVAFLLSAGLAAFSGALYATYTSYIEPGMYGWTRSAELIIMVFFGGLNSITGAMVSTVLLSGLPELLRFAKEWRTVFYCLIIVFAINFRPQGLLGDRELTLTWLTKLVRRRRPLPAAVAGRER